MTPPDPELVRLRRDVDTANNVAGFAAAMGIILFFWVALLTFSARDSGIQERTALYQIQDLRRETNDCFERPFSPNLEHNICPPNRGLASGLRR